MVNAIHIKLIAQCLEIYAPILFDMQISLTCFDTFSWVPMLVGIALMLIGWSSRSGAWLHVRVRPNKASAPRLIAISLPIPLGLTAWFINTFGPRIHGMDDQAMKEVLEALDQRRTGGAPFYVKVDESASGAEVEVFIG